MHDGHWQGFILCLTSKQMSMKVEGYQSIPLLFFLSGFVSPGDLQAVWILNSIERIKGAPCFML